MRKKLNLTDIEKEELRQSGTVYCTECGDSLDNFGCEESLYDLSKIQENFKKCKQIGKFKGDICSKLFILSEDVEEPET